MASRQSSGLHVADFSLGYVRFVYPCFLEVPFYLYGEEWNTKYTPVEFR